jgi:hypothetical protein
VSCAFLPPPGVAHPAIAETKEDNINELPKVDYTKLKLINLSTILYTTTTIEYYCPFTLMFALKQKKRTCKTTHFCTNTLDHIAPIVFILGIFLKLGHQFTIIPHSSHCFV